MTEESGRIKPQDINAEAAILSAMIVDSGIVAHCLEKIRKDHFSKTSHQIIFETIRSLFDEGIEIDIITLIDRLKQDNNLAKVGGKAFINELSDVVISGANIDYHMKIVRNKAVLRNLIDTSREIIKSCYEANRSVEDLLDEAEQNIFRIAENRGEKTFTSVKDIAKNTLEHIDEIARSKKAILGVPSGFTDLDRQLGGFRSGQFIVVAARPGMGKSSFALNVASNAAVRHDKKVGIFTMEMEAEECLMRMLASASGVSMSNMLKGYGMDERKVMRISGVADALSEKEIYIDDSGANTIFDIKAKTRRLKAELGGLDLVIIDYLQLMSSSGNNKENRQQEIAEISRSLKVLAKELQVPIIALSQLNRGVENRDDKRPKLADLRESGAIEQDADVVMFIYRDEVYNRDKEENKGLAEIIIQKNRHGPQGTINLKFFGETTSFDNYAEYE
ncbi:MAG TPA: replicative DNA helicase [Candidatus Cloacimonas sp.]|jgi:replicative DNA helicase|nr:replicative helicase [Candidatus Cloacimonadota bacterium]HCX72932.1 replicative DNA helicase [Candidatus Cloacimonas sp.]